MKLGNDEERSVCPVGVLVKGELTVEKLTLSPSRLKIPWVVDSGGGEDGLPKRLKMLLFDFSSYD